MPATDKNSTSHAEARKLAENNRGQQHDAERHLDKAYGLYHDASAPCCLATQPEVFLAIVSVLFSQSKPG